MKGAGSARARVAWSGLAAGPLLAAMAYVVLPDRYAHATSGDLLVLGHAGRATVAVMVWMAVWWLTEAIDISATALLPIVLLPVAGAAGIAEATTPYANKLIFLFFGGFLLALSMQRWGLDRRIALIALRLVGTRPANMIAGVMGATALLSMFVSNTATAAMMLPIAMSVVAIQALPNPGPSIESSGGHPADRAKAGEDDPVHEGVGKQGEIGTCHRGPEVAGCRAPA